MLHIEKTVSKFGYNPLLLSSGSNRVVSVVCDYCQKEYERPLKGRDKSNSIIDKDACIDCRFKKREEISLKQFGVKNSAQRKDVREKISGASSERLKSEEFKEQAKATNLAKYGNEVAMRSDIVKNIYKKAIQDKYGVDNVSELGYIRDKAKQTCLEKYGNVFPSKTEMGKAEIVAGCQEKYGCDNVFQNEEVKEKIKQTSLIKYGFTHHLKDKKLANINTKKGVKTRIKQGKIRLYDNKTVSEWAEEVGFSKSHFSVLVTRYGFELAIQMEPHISSLETLTMAWLSSENIEYQKHHRVDNRIADIYIPSHKILIELDGLYWHSDAIIEDKNYHVNKRQLYLDNGYKPLFFREPELTNKDRFEIVKSVIKNKLGQSTQVYARKCEIKEISKEVAKDFFITNHLMGNGAGNTYGLFYNNSPISAIQIKKIKDGYEVSRFCNILNYSVMGGFSKLLSFLNKNILGGKPLTTFIDLRYGTGDYLTSLGFVYQHTYPSFKWTDGSGIYNRMRFPGNSGYERGLFRIWDCGQAKFVYCP